MWRQHNQHLSLAHPQALSTQPYVHSSNVGEFPVMKPVKSAEAVKVTTVHLFTVAQQLRWSSSKLLFNSCSAVTPQHSLPGFPCLNLTLPLIPENYSVTAPMENHFGHSGHPVHSKWKSLEIHLFLMNQWKNVLYFHTRIHFSAAKNYVQIKHLLQKGHFFWFVLKYSVPQWPFQIPQHFLNYRTFKTTFKNMFASLLKVHQFHLCF